MFSVQCCNVQCTLRQTRHAASSRRHSLVTGRVREESFVFTSAVQPCESSPGNTFVTRPSNQRDLGTVLSTTRTRSFTAKFLLFSSHLWRCCRVGTYSRTHRDQKQLARNCATACVSTALPSRRHQGVWQDFDAVEEGGLE